MIFFVKRLGLPLSHLGLSCLGPRSDGVSFSLLAGRLRGGARARKAARTLTRKRGLQRAVLCCFWGRWSWSVGGARREAPVTSHGTLAQQHAIYSIYSKSQSKKTQRFPLLHTFLSQRQLPCSQLRMRYKRPIFDEAFLSPPDIFLPAPLTRPDNFRPAPLRRICPYNSIRCKNKI